MNYDPNHREDRAIMLAALRRAQRFIDDLKENYPEIPQNSDSGMDWDTAMAIQDAIAKATA